MSELRIEGLRAEVAGIEILRGVDLAVRSGEVHAVMGPNGCGKSTLSHTLMGRSDYRVTAGSVMIDGAELLGLPTWERAAKGLFLAMQYPVEVPGVPIGALIGASLRSRGLDVDALRDVSRRVEAMTKEGALGVLAITHYSRLLTELRPDFVHVMLAGRVVASGGPELADELEAHGYEGLAERLGVTELTIERPAEPKAGFDRAKTQSLADLLKEREASAQAGPLADPFADPLR